MGLNSNSKANFIPRQILLYIVYGDDQVYYDGAIFSFLTFMHWLEADSCIEIYLLTEKPEKFIGYPVNLILMSDQQKNEWSLNGQYHFRIKNRGLAFVMDELKLGPNGGLVYCMEYLVDNIDWLEETLDDDPQHC